jgi:sulfoxide reductase heme-binding subunit YedZ
MAAPHPWLKPALLLGGCSPGAIILLRAARGTLAADPIAEALNRFGLLALVFLLASLACTPARLLTGWTWPARVRRMLGLFAFAYAAAHVLTWAVADRGLEWRAILEDLTLRPFIIAGALAFALLVPLAATSTSRMVRRLGHRRWQALHRLAYPATALACLHFFWRVKADLTEPLVYAAVLAVLLGVRLAVALRARKGKGGTVRGPRSEHP